MSGLGDIAVFGNALFNQLERGRKQDREDYELSIKVKNLQRQLALEALKSRMDLSKLTAENPEIAETLLSDPGAVSALGLGTSAQGLRTEATRGRELRRAADQHVADAAAGRLRRNAVNPDALRYIKDPAKQIFEPIDRLEADEAGKDFHDLRTTLTGTGGMSEDEAYRVARDQTTQPAALSRFLKDTDYKGNVQGGLRTPDDLEKDRKAGIAQAILQQVNEGKANTEEAILRLNQNGVSLDVIKAVMPKIFQDRELAQAFWMELNKKLGAGIAPVVNLEDNQGPQLPGRKPLSFRDAYNPKAFNLTNIEANEAGAKAEATERGKEQAPGYSALQSARTDLAKAQTERSRDIVTRDKEKDEMLRLARSISAAKELTEVGILLRASKLPPALLKNLTDELMRMTDPQQRLNLVSKLRQQALGMSDDPNDEAKAFIGGATRPSLPPQAPKVTGARRLN